LKCNEIVQEVPEILRNYLKEKVAPLSNLARALLRRWWQAEEREV